MPNKSTDNSNHTSRALRPIAAPSQRPLSLRDGLGPGNSFGEKAVSPSFLLWVFQQWWKVGIPVGAVLAATAAVLVIYSYVPRYEARSLLMIEDYSPYVAFSQSSVSRESQRYIQTQLEILRSPVVLEPVLSRPEIAAIQELKEGSDPVELLLHNRSIRPLGGSELYNVSYVRQVPKNA